MVTLDRRKLTAPILAQAAAFVVVLAIGSVTGHGAAKPPHPRSSPSSSPARHVRTTPPVTTPPDTTPAAGNTELSILIAQTGDFGVVMPAVTVAVLKDNPALTFLFSRQLAEGIAGTPVVLGPVPVGHAYQVCVDPPPDWMFTDQSTGVRRGWDCRKVDAGFAAQQVTFHLLPKSPITGTVP